MRMSRLPEAEHWYVESLRSKSDHIPAHLTYGKLLALTGRKSEAEKYFMKAIQLDPTKGNCYMHYGQFLLEESRLIEAAEMAKKAAELDNTEFDVVFNAAHMLRQLSSRVTQPFGWLLKQYLVVCFMFVVFAVLLLGGVCSLRGEQRGVCVALC
ncbi:hypothetical protein EK904_001618 [Melospiza melodia maxima]|nr:hypothetical protein EK904_001618 [Melospiza melodia maxima]